MKKIMVVLLVASMGTALLAGCGSSDESASADTETAVEEAAEDEADTGVEEELEAEGEAEAEEEAVESTETASSSGGILTYIDGLADQDLYVGVSTGTSGTPWRDQLEEDLEIVFQEYIDSGDIVGYKFVHNTNNGDANEQAEIIRNFIDDDDVNIILVNPNDTTALDEAIYDAEAAGKLVVAIDNPVSAEGVLSVTFDNYFYAYDPACTFFDLLGGEGDVIEISGIEGQPNDVIRIGAVDDALELYPNINLLQRTPGGWENTTSKEVTDEILAAGLRPDGIISQNSECYGILQACVDADYIPKVVSGDGTKQFFALWKELIDEGYDFNSVVGPTPPGIGASAARIAIKMAQGRTFDESLLDDDGNYEYVVSVYYTNDNFDDGWEVLKDQDDEYSLDEYFTDEEAEALFID